MLKSKNKPLSKINHGIIKLMIQAESNLQVADNSGARLIYCIKVIGWIKRRYARIGDIIIVSVKDAIPRSKLKKVKYKELLSLEQRNL